MTFLEEICALNSRRAVRAGMREQEPEWRTKGEYDILFPMARRPDPAEFDQPLDKEELKELSRRLARLSPHHVADAYRNAHEACRMDGENLPRASDIQALVTAWKLTRAWKLRKPVQRD